MAIRFKVYSMKKNYKQAKMMDKIDRKELDKTIKEVITSRFDSIHFFFLIKTFLSKHGWNVRFILFIYLFIYLIYLFLIHLFNYFILFIFLLLFSFI